MFGQFLWVNLPPQLEMAAPSYAGLQRGDIPAIALDGGRVTLNLVSGSFAGMTGPVRSLFHLAELNEEGDGLEIGAESGALVLFGHASPINAPVVRHGPFVMNTREEIVAAIDDYQAGKFGAMRG